VRRLTALLGREVVTESGEKLGRCFDLRAERSASKLEVTGLVVGAEGLLERLGIGPSRGEAKRHHKTWRHDAVPWEAVVRIEGKRIVVKDGTEPGA
jgi:sporulation protein YlmC with PRC-barrel domain